MKLFKGAMLAAALLAGGASFNADAIGWPANYEGVMLQGFYWDSWNVTGWSKLEAMSDELSESFKLIWVPNSAKAASNPGNGYDPVYWFTNHNTCWGTEAELRSMIATFKSKGTGIIEDVVINHRSGATNWTDFPAETWNGTTWKIGPEGICSTDEVRYASGQATPTGAPDTGEDFDGSRDLDHTNANVQNNCKNYCKFLLEDMGYAGFRYDMVKGYSGQYTKIYNQYAKPTYSVGEYWDGNYDAVKAWIEATGKESAAFDFPFKYAVNEAFSSGDMTKLVWKANGTNNQPAGMIHYGYAQLAVTFIDNHDTYRDGSKFNGNVLAANAFMICSPGTPCVFYPHWTQYKSQIKAMIAVRNAVGVHNCSKVTVLQSSNNCYMAEVEGTKGKLVVKIGSAMVSPSGYSDSDIKASGNDYCIWSKVSVQGGGNVGGGDTSGYPSKMYLIGNINDWGTATSIAPDKAENGVYTWNAANLKAAEKDTYSYFSFVTAQGADWDEDVNSSDRYGASTKDEAITSTATITKFTAGVNASSAYSWKAAAGTYKVVADLTKMTLTITSNGDTPVVPDDPDPVVPDDPATDVVTIYFDNSSANWTTPYIHYWGGTASTWPGVAMSKVEGNIWKYDCPAGTTGCLFNAGDGDATKTVDFVAKHGHVYTKAGDQGEYQGGSTPDPVVPDNPTTDIVRIYFDNSSANWTTPYIHYWGGTSSSTWPGVAMSKVEGNIWKYECPAGTTGCLFNAGDGDATKTEDFAAIHNHLYSRTADWGEYEGGGGDDPIVDPTDEYPATLYLMGNITGWDPSVAIAHHEKESGVYKWNKVELPAAEKSEYSYFTFVTAVGAHATDWDTVNNGGHRYGASTQDEEVSSEATITKFPVNVNASSAYSWMTKAGSYNITADLKNMKVTLTSTSGVEVIDFNIEDATPVYYNMQGVRVDNPANGIYIVVRGNKVSKEIIK